MHAELVRRVAALDLADVQSAFATGLAADAPYHHREATGLEYRRFLLMALSHPNLDVTAGGPVERYRRLHAAHPRFAAQCAALAECSGIDAQRVVTRAGGQPSGDDVRDLYLGRFPSGDADLWGWAPSTTAPRTSAPELGVVHARLTGAIDDRTHERLRREARSLRPRVADGHSTAFSIERGCVSGGFGGFASTEAGPVLHDWHWRASLARRVTEETGVAVVPTGVFYNVHRDGDGSPLHNDPYATELVVLTLLDGPVEPLYLHPELAEVPLTDVRAVSMRSGGHPDGGLPFDIRREPLLMSGQTVPHHRRPTGRSTEVVVAAQFFGVLAPVS